MTRPVVLGEPRPRRRGVALGVNIDHVATVRQARRAAEPDPVTLAALAELGGADQITVHLREDRRHIQDRDLALLRQTVRTRLNLEMAATEEMVRIALSVRPESATLVPERREEVTTEGGLDVAGSTDALREIARRLREGGIEVSAFIDPDGNQLRAAIDARFEGVEFHTGAYANAAGDAARAEEIARLERVAALAARAGAKVKVGHGLTYANVKPVIRIPEVEEANIGHSIVSRALAVGMESAVRQMAALLREAASEGESRA
jgi:pyridoxine 5-phosphate synthase